jgi:predicted nucleic acid-binding protein
MIVLDASAAVDWFLTTPGGRVVGTRILAYGESLHAPQMFDLEVTQAFRKLARAGALSESRAEEAVQDLRRVVSSATHICRYFPASGDTVTI